MDRVLVTGGSHAEIPLIEALHQMNYYVITTGNNEDGLGHKIADKYIKGDFSDPEFVYSLAKENNVSGIVSGCNDFAYLSTAYACEKLGFFGHDDVKGSRMIHHKDLFRSLLRKCDLPCPQSIKILEENQLEGAADKLNFPLLIKPVDLTGGKGVKVCYDTDEMRMAYTEAMQWTREEYVIAEQMIVGSNHGVSMLLKDKKVVFSFFDNEEYYLNPYLVSGANAPADVSHRVKEDVVHQIEKLAEEGNLVDGLFHCQCIITDDEQVFLIDPCRRAPGDLYIKLVEYVTGMPYGEAVVRAELGLDFEELTSSMFESRRCVARECIMTDKEGVFEGVHFSDELSDYIKDQLIWATQGDEVKDVLKYKAGIVFFEFPNKREMRSSLKDLYQKMTIIMR